MIKKNYGLPGILNGTTDSEAELMDQARAAVAKKLGVSSLAKPVMHAPTDRDEDLYYVSKIKPIEIKNKFGKRIYYPQVHKILNRPHNRQFI